MDIINKSNLEPNPEPNPEPNLLIKDENVIILFNIFDSIYNSIIIDFSHLNIYENNDIRIITEKLIKNMDIIKTLYANNIFNFNSIEYNEIINSLCKLTNIYTTIVAHKNINENTTCENTTHENILKIDDIDDMTKSQKQIVDEEHVQKRLKYYKKIKKALGHVVYNAFRKTDFHIFMSNVPIESITLNNTEIKTPITPEIIFDTVELQNGDDTIYSVLQVSRDSYLITFKNFDDSKKICNILDKTRIENNTIRVYLINEKENVNIIKIKDENISDKHTIEVKELINTKDDTPTQTTPIQDTPIPTPTIPIQDTPMPTPTTPTPTTPKIFNESMYMVNELDFNNLNQYSGNELNIETQNETQNETQTETQTETQNTSMVYSFYNKICNIANFILRR